MANTGTHVRIAGNVQGVGFRAWTEKTARARGLSGWVRNHPDGSVEAVFHGATEEVRLMVEDCRTGPAGAEVTSVETRDVEGVATDPAGAGFEIRSGA